MTSRQRKTIGWEQVGPTERRLEALLDDEGVSAAKAAAPGEFTLPSERKESLVRYEFELLREDLGSAARAIGRAAGKIGLYLVGGGLPADYQMQLEERLGKEFYRAETATFISVGLKFVVYGVLSGMYLQSVGAEPAMGIPAGLVLGLAEFRVRAWRSEHNPHNPRLELVVGEPIMTALSLPYRLYENAVNYRSDLRERALKLQEKGKANPQGNAARDSSDSLS